jgi:hypothetical protein
VIPQPSQTIRLVAVKPKKNSVLVEEGQIRNLGDSVTLGRQEDHLAAATQVRIVRAAVQVSQRTLLSRCQLNKSGWWHLVIYLIAYPIIHQLSAIPNNLCGAI